MLQLCQDPWDKVSGPVLPLAYMGTAARVRENSPTGWSLTPASPICLVKASASPTFLLPSYSGPGLQLLEGCSHFETLKWRAD